MKKNFKHYMEMAQETVAIKLHYSEHIIKLNQLVQKYNVIMTDFQNFINRIFKKENDIKEVEDSTGRGYWAKGSEQGFDKGQTYIIPEGSMIWTHTFNIGVDGLLAWAHHLTGVDDFQDFDSVINHIVGDGKNKDKKIDPDILSELKVKKYDNMNLKGEYSYKFHNDQLELKLELWYE